jgi:hypothetical protein
VVAERGAGSRDIGDPGGVGQPVVCDLGERVGARNRPQERDVVERKRYDGLTPVIITL